MTVELIGVITLLVGLVGLAARPNFIVYAFFGSTLLGAAAAIILNSLGGTTIQPAHLLLGFLVIKLLNNRERRIEIYRSASVGTPGFWLIMTLIYAVITAYLMPRLFQGQTLAYAVRAQGANYPAPLGPATSNLTQSIYFVSDCICFLVFLGFGRSDAGRKCLEKAALMCVVLNLFFTALDLITYATNTGEFLSFIRNSTYSILSDNESAGFRRTIGSFVEASSFGYWTAGYFAFVTSLWLSGYAPRRMSVLAILSLIALLLSTSTTGYVALAIYLLVQFAECAFRLSSQPVRPQVLFFLTGIPIAMVVLVLIICISDESYAYISGILGDIIFNKMSSASGVERSSWNAQAIQNFLDTFGLGAGNGSVRASSFPVAMIGNLGIPGAVTYSMFLLSVLFRRTEAGMPLNSPMQMAARSACLTWLIAATISAGGIDFGLSFFAFAALACASERGSRSHRMALQAAVSYR